MACAENVGCAIGPPSQQLPKFTSHLLLAFVTDTEKTACTGKEACVAWWPSMVRFEHEQPSRHVTCNTCANEVRLVQAQHDITSHATLTALATQATSGHPRRFSTLATQATVTSLNQPGHPRPLRKP